MSKSERITLNLPTLDDVRLWEERLGRLKAEEAEMKARHAAEEKALKTKRTRLERLVAAASAFVEIIDEAEPETDSEQRVVEVEATPAPGAPAARPGVRRGKAQTWTATIYKIIRKSGRGMSYSEVKDELGKTHLGDTLKRTEKAFYGGIGKLAEKKKIVKHNGRLYTRTIYRRFMEDVAAGRVAELPAPPIGGEESPNEIAVERFLSSRPDGATTVEIVDSLLINPPPDLAVTKNRNSIYNLLARHRKRGKLIRRGDRYYLPQQEGETPGPFEPSASYHYGNGNGAPSPTGNGEFGLSAALPGTGRTDPLGP